MRPYCVNRKMTAARAEREAKAMLREMWGVPINLIDPFDIGVLADAIYGWYWKGYEDANGRKQNA